MVYGISLIVNLVLCKYLTKSSSEHVRRPRSKPFPDYKRSASYSLDLVHSEWSVRGHPNSDPITVLRSSDCNYEHLEQLLDEEWRRYINKIVMTPISVTKQDYNSFCRGLDHDEKVFISAYDESEVSQKDIKLPIAPS